MPRPRRCSIRSPNRFGSPRELAPWSEPPEHPSGVDGITVGIAV